MAKTDHGLSACTYAAAQTPFVAGDKNKRHGRVLDVNVPGSCASDEHRQMDRPTPEGWTAK